MDEPQVYVTQIGELYPPQGLWTEADYLRLPQSTRVVELASGRLTIRPAHTPEHQRIAGELALLLDQFVEPNKLGEVLYAPLPVRLWLNQIRMPDILFLRAGREDRKRKMWIDGAPDWIAEIVAPDTRALDEGEKLADYARAGVPETWLVDPENRCISAYTLRSDEDRYTLASLYGPGTDARAETLPGFEVAVDRLFE